MKEELRNQFFICSCGRRTSTKPGFKAKHVKSLLHRQRKSVLRLLKKNCLTFREIGERFGVSGEWVRQINAGLGLSPGQKRSTACSVTKVFQRWNKLPHIVALKSKNLEVRPFMEKFKHPNRVWRKPYKKTVRVNGRICLINKAITRTRKLEALPKISSELPDFVLTSSSRGWFVFPAKDYPPKGTSITWEPKPNYGNGRGRNYLHLLEAWGLLGDPKKSLDTDA